MPGPTGQDTAVRLIGPIDVRGGLSPCAEAPRASTRWHQRATVVARAVVSLPQSTLQVSTTDDLLARGGEPY